MLSPFSRVMSAGTAAYGVFALAKPRHLGAAMSDAPDRQKRYDLVATTYGCRDLVVSSVGLLSGSAQGVRAAMLIRIALDVADCALLTPRAETSQGRKKIVAATLSWASLNCLAALVDRHRR